MKCAQTEEIVLPSDVTVLNNEPHVHDTQSKTHMRVKWYEYFVFDQGNKTDNKSQRKQLLEDYVSNEIKMFNTMKK